MCGIAGVVRLDAQKIELNVLREMTDVIKHRGPDGEGHWLSVDETIGLGHRRLSIIDLSEDGNQPMHYLERYSITFNGEIYNYIELREELILHGYTFKGKSDTEVLLALYDKYKEDALHKIDGMFAFALYDQVEGELFCARDRFGEKPFFYSYAPNKYFIFGSEMKVLWQSGIIKREINQRMLFNYMTLGFIENPYDLSETFYTNCTRLPHAHYIKLNIKKQNLEIKRYYDIGTNTIDKNANRTKINNTFKELFYTSVTRRLRSDVAVGSGLSGGLDSSLIVSVINDLNKKGSIHQNTFSAIFPGYYKDEKKYIDIVINNVNAKPHFVIPDGRNFIADLPNICMHQEEPFASTSIYAQYCVMRLTKESGVKVLLDGQGADEILAGYHHYFKPYFNELKKNFSSNFKQQKLAYTTIHNDNTVNGLLKYNLPDILRAHLPFAVNKLKKLKILFEQSSNSFLNKDFFASSKNQLYQSIENSGNNLNSTLYNSTMNYGLQQLLRYADRNSMAHSVEARFPFLNHDLVNFLFSLPLDYKINNGWTKWLVRDTFDVLPEEIRWRKDKIAYEPPQEKWMSSENFKAILYESVMKLVKEKYLDKNVFPKFTDLSSEKQWGCVMIGHMIT